MNPEYMCAWSYRCESIVLVCMELQEGIHSTWSYRRESIVLVCMELQEGIHSACVHGATGGNP